MIDRNSPTWVAIEKEVKARLKTARDALELPGPIESAQLQRGRIQAFREILAIGKPTQQIVTDRITAL